MTIACHDKPWQHFEICRYLIMTWFSQYEAEGFVLNCAKMTKLWWKGLRFSYLPNLFLRIEHEWGQTYTIIDIFNSVSAVSSCCGVHAHSHCSPSLWLVLWGQLRPGSLERDRASTSLHCSHMPAMRCVWSPITTWAAQHLTGSPSLHWKNVRRSSVCHSLSPSAPLKVNNG